MNDLYEQLVEDEEILWEGHPDKKAFILTSFFGTGFIFSAIWFIFTVILSKAAIESGLTLDKIKFPKIISISFIFLWLTPIWFYLLNCFTSFSKYKKYYYLITDKRLIIRSGLYSYSYDIIFYQNITDLHISVETIDLYCGSGTISMTQAGHYGEKYTMLNIPNWTKVFLILQEAIKKITDENMFSSIF